MVEFRRILSRTMTPWRTRSSTTIVVFFIVIAMMLVVCVVEDVLTVFEGLEVGWSIWGYYLVFLQWDLRGWLLLLGTTDNFRTHTAIRGPWFNPP